MGSRRNWIILTLVAGLLLIDRVSSHAFENPVQNNESNVNKLKNGQRIVFIGDSNTFAGKYVADLEAMAILSGLECDWINVGLPSETCCGLSEPDHPFPRPTVEERIDRVLSKTNPDVVVACYGMNDAIYHPFSEKRFDKYQDGIKNIIDKVKAAKAKLILLTPPPFDPLPLGKKSKLASKDAKKFAWFQPYEDYDTVLEKYSSWILTLDDQVDAVVNIRKPVVQFLETERKTKPEFTMSGDGVHFNATCHRIIARTLAKTLIDKPVLDPAPKVVELTNKKMLLLRNSWLTHTGHTRPKMSDGLPLEKAKKLAQEIDQKLAAELK